MARARTSFALFAPLETIDTIVTDAIGTEDRAHPEEIGVDERQEFALIRSCVPGDGIMYLINIDAIQRACKNAVEC